MLVLVIVSLLLVVAQAKLFQLGGDPADSWLAYAIAPGNGKKVTMVNSTWTVPSWPTIRGGGNAPGWWYGIEPSPAVDLIQPILAYGYTGETYSIFNGYYQWDDEYWWHSDTNDVTPGQTIKASVWYDAPSDSYNMKISCVETGWSVVSNIPVESGKLYTDTYFVVEHQPNSCGEYPANGGIVFRNIYIEIEGKPITPQWKAFTYQDACNCKATINSPSQLTFNWQTS